MEENIPNIDLKKLRLEIWEMEKPEEVMEVELEIKKKILEVQEQIQDLVEGKVENYFKEREIKQKEYKPSYIG